MTSPTARPTGRDTQRTPEAGPDIDDVLGWEGHVNIPNAPMLDKLLRNWPELRTGLAFSMVFVVGALVGGALCALVSGGKKSAEE